MVLSFECFRVFYYFDCVEKKCRIELTTKTIDWKFESVYIVDFKLIMWIKKLWYVWSCWRKKVLVFKFCANSLFLLCTFRKSLKQKRKALSRKFILNRLHYSHFTPTFLFRVAKDFYWVSVLRFEAALSSCVNISGQRPYRALPSAACHLRPPQAPSRCPFYVSPAPTSSKFPPARVLLSHSITIKIMKLI